MKAPSTSRISTLVLTLSLLTGVAVAQESPAAKDDAVAPPRTVLKALRYVQPAAVRQLLTVLDVTVAHDEGTQTLALRGQPGDLETALKMIDALDEPSPLGGNVELRGYVVWARDGAQGGLPAELGDTLRHVEELVPGKGFELADTLFLQVSQDSKSNRISSPLASGGLMTFGFDRVTVVLGEPPVVRIRGLSFMTSIPETSISVDVDLREGQQAVVGKASLGGDKGAMLLVLEVDVVGRDGD